MSLRIIEDHPPVSWGHLSKTSAKLVLHPPSSIHFLGCNFKHTLNISKVPTTCTSHIFPKSHGG